MSSNNEFVQSLAASLKNLGAMHAVGEQWVSVHGLIPKGGIPYCGQEVSRTTYAALWQWVNENNLVVTEAEWHSISSSQNGNVSKYSDGDGSTTFRLPCIVGYVKCAGALGEAGAYTSEGLPNIVGEITYITAENPNISSTDYPTNGAFLWKNEAYTKKASTASGNGSRDLSFDASRCSAIYGNSTHVTPETMSVIFGVYAFGEVTNVGSVDLGSLAQQLSEISTTYLPTAGGTMGGSIKNLSSDGQMTIVNKDLNIGTNPSAVMYKAIHWADATGAVDNNHRLATVEYSVSTAGAASLNIGPYQWIANRGSWKGCMLKLSINAAGACTANVAAAFSATSIQATSDARLKSNIVNYSADLSGIGTYRYTLDSEQKNRVGLIAQEVKGVIPEAVSEDEKGYYSLDYNAIVAVLVGKVNDLEKRLKELEVN